MSWKIRLVENPPLHGPHESEWYNGTVDFSKLAIGDLCFYHHLGKPCADPAILARLNLTRHYFKSNASRPPLLLAMPDAATKSPRYFMVDGQCYSGACKRCGQQMRKCKCGGAYSPKGYYDGWTVAGVPPLITVHPSVNFDVEGEHRYHGWIKAGVIGDG